MIRAHKEQRAKLSHSSFNIDSKVPLILLHLTIHFSPQSRLNGAIKRAFISFLKKILVRLNLHKEPKAAI